jgi:hypothetical protein
MPHAYMQYLEGALRQDSLPYKRGAGAVRCLAGICVVVAAAAFHEGEYEGLRGACDRSMCCVEGITIFLFACFCWWVREAVCMRERERAKTKASARFWVVMVIDVLVGLTALQPGLQRTRLSAQVGLYCPSLPWFWLGCHTSESCA